MQIAVCEADESHERGALQVRSGLLGSCAVALGESTTDAHNFDGSVLLTVC